MCYDVVIFGNDSVLTKPTLLEVQREAVRRALDESDVESMTEAVDGTVNDGPTRLCRTCAVHDVSVDDFWSHHETYAAAIQQACLENGMKPLYDGVATLDGIDHPLVVASNNQRATTEHILDVFDIGDRSEAAYSRDPVVEDARVKKPDLHYIERATGKLGVDSVLCVGNSNADVVAAGRAGIDSAFIRRPYCDGYQLAAEPTYELDLLDELLAVC